jgi:hypothetical protein
MSRLDQHVRRVQNKLMLVRFVGALARTALVAAIVVAVGVIVWRVLGYANLPPMKWWLVGVGVIAGGVGIFAWWRRPSAVDAAVVIDERLNLDEKFSTALYARPIKSPFAQAAVADAEQTAGKVQLHRQFPIRFPRVGYAAMAVMVVAMSLALWMKPWPARANRLNQQQTLSVTDAQKAKAREQVEQAIAIAETAPRSVANDPKLLAEVKALHDMLKSNDFDDPAHAQHKAQEALQDVKQEMADQSAKDNQQEMEEKKTFSESFGDAKDYQTEVAKVDNDLAKGDFDHAADNIAKIADKFEKLTDEQKQKTADDMQKLAEKLQHAADDPKVQQELQQKLQQMGATQQQAKEMAQKMADAAQGDRQAQQQLQNQVQQMQQQLKQQIQQAQQQAQQGNPQAQQQLAQLQQQQQQIQQAIQKMQAQANAQAQAQQMSQAAQQMSQAMQQQQQRPQGPHQGSQPAASKNGQPAQAKNQQQQMAAAQQQMQQAMQSMQAAQADAKQVQAMQQQMAQGNGSSNGNGEGNSGSSNGSGSSSDHQGSMPQFVAGGQAGNCKGPGVAGAFSRGGGSGGDKVASGFDLKAETDVGAQQDKGKTLANMMIKDNHPIVGQAKIGLSAVTESAQRQASEEVDEERVSGESRQAAEEYFRTLPQDAPATPQK